MARLADRGAAMIVCPVCAGRSATRFLEREPVAVHQNLLVDTRDAARALNRGRLDLHACADCGFVFNAAFDPALLTYGEAYENTQSYSPAFEAHVEQLADHLVQARGLRGSRVIEIGCGKGAFLRAVVRRDPGNEGIGFDPSYIGPDHDVDGRARFERRFYDEHCGDLRPDAVLCRHVIEHIPDPVALLRLVRSTLGPSSRVFFETPCVEWILRHEVIWDFFYEHCSYFTPGSARTAFSRAGYVVDDVRHVFGGQYLWVEAHPAATPAEWRTDDHGRVAALAAAFGGMEAARVTTLRRRLERFAASGRVAMWGAAAKGVTLAGLVDPAADLLDCVVDLNPHKQGRFLPGTGHPIVAPHDLPSRGVDTAVMTNPNYLEETSRMLQQAGIPVRLVDLMQQPESDADAHHR